MAAKTKIGLRERKFATTKVNLLKALLNQLKAKAFEDISVTELCDEAFISEAGFYNYFPKKTDLLIYYIQVWSIEIGYLIKVEGSKKGREAIESIFEHTAEKFQKNRNVMKAIIPFQMGGVDTANAGKVTPYERELLFGAKDGIDEVPDQGLSTLVPPLIRQAIDLGELPPGVGLNQVAFSIYTVFFGAPVFLADKSKEMLAKVYQQQLDAIWIGYQNI